ALPIFSLNLLTYVGVSLLRSPGLRERLQAAKFLEDAVDAEAPDRALPRSSTKVADLRELLERFLGPELATSALADYAAKAGPNALDHKAYAGPELARYVEQRLGGRLGTSSARLVLSTTLRGHDMQPEDVVRLLDETSHAIQFNR